MKCAVTACQGEASSGLVINVPAKNMPIKEHDPIQLVIGVRLCAECLHKEAAAKWLAHSVIKGGPPNRLRQIVEVQFKARGLVEPDFERAFTTGIPFDSAEWRALRGGRSP